MTLESLHFVETTPSTEQDIEKLLILRREEASRELGRVSVELAQVSHIYNKLILEIIQLNQKLAEGGTDKHAIALMIQSPTPAEESPLFSGEPFVEASENGEYGTLKAVSGF
ncbi:MAG: hypothetical protein JWO54_560 [Candidatus Saccharibacteria bacterium]|nr:hypothetical protein [Candidatus Saccharibacteria bacterium]MDB5180779.1 hypothetical protein [Candidatus Saccharibacteria bacterium]MDB5180800.1 hypothetical protein [Candidatus Saccharibacteria bacterium]